MIQTFIELLFNQPGVKNIIVDVDPVNKRAFHCYINSGFKLAKEIMTPDGLACLLEIKKD